MQLMRASRLRRDSDSRTTGRRLRSGWKSAAIGLEALENRQLLSTYNVATSGSDSASGASASPFKTIQKAASVLRAGDTLNIRAGSYAGLDASGLSGTQSAPITIQADPAATPGSVVINSPDDQSDGITVDGSQWLTIQGLTVKASAMSRDGIRIVSGSNNTSIVNCDVSGANRFGLFASGSSNVRIEGSYLHDNPGDGSAMTGHDAYITGGCINAIFRGNTVARAGSQGLHMNADGGAVSGALVENNTFIDNVNNGINCDGVTNSTFRNNVIVGSTKHGISMYQIDGATGSTGNVIENNTIYSPNSSGAGIQLTASSTGNTIFNNIIVGGSDGAINVSSDSKSGMVSDYNAVQDRFTNNGSIVNLSSWRSGTGQDAHSFVAPSASTLFVNSGAGDYHLRSGSPAIDAGTSSLNGKSAPTSDLEGNARPAGGAFDIGAYESGSTAPTSDTTAPTISGVGAANLSSSGATVSWTTNESSDSQVEYGTSTSYGSSTSLNTSQVTNHSAAVAGLQANTLYHYRVKSSDAAGNLAVSGDFTFTTTAAADTTAPTLSAIAAGTLANTSATITWATNEASDTQVEYGTSTSYGSATALDGTLVTNHSAALSSLQAGTQYHYRVKSRDAAGNLAVSGDFTFTTTSATSPDTTPPAIWAIAASGTTTNSANISWTSDEPSDTQVEYGTSTSYGSSTALNTALVTSHNAGLSNLQAGTVYHYRVKSRDAAGNLAVTADQTFTTVAAPTSAGDTTPPTASLSANNVTSRGATSYTFKVTYTDNVRVSVSTLGNREILVNGPNGYSQLATLVSIDINSNGTPRTATYRITPPGGFWNRFDNGTYSVVMRANKVLDTAGNPVAPGTIGTFSVRI